MTGSNLKQILVFLPLRVRQEHDDFDKAETNASRRKEQYMKVKSWIKKIHEKLLMSGIRVDETSDSQVTMVTTSNQSQNGSKNSMGGNSQNNKNNRYQKQERNRKKRWMGH